MYKKLKFCVFALLFGGTVFASNAFIHVQNSVAGMDIPVRISGLHASESVVLQLIRPDDTEIFFEKEASADGIIEIDILGFHLRKSGNYSLKLIRNIGETKQSFFISSGKVSAYRSSIKLFDESVTADGEHQARFQVLLKDAFGNPIPHQKVAIFSSRNEDIVTASLRSDLEGIVQGKLVSATPGIATLSAVTENVVLFQKPEVVFYLPNSDMLNVGSGENPSGMGQYLKAQLFDDQEGGEVAYFSLENIKREATINENLTVKVVAKDENGDVAQNYTGTIRFSSSDDRAVLPKDYRFTVNDQGTHTFFLAVGFKTPGSHTLAVHDLNDFRISGELSMSITMGDDGEVEIPKSNEKSVTLLTPRPGTFRTSRVTITGKSNDCGTVKLIDGTFVLVEELEVDQVGNFVFQTPTLADGVHQFEAICGRDETVISNQISIKIDRTAPQNITVRVDPSENIEKEQLFKVIVSADEPLSGANSVFLDVLTPHELEGKDFVTTLTAPTECGDYPVDVTATDLLGNEKKFPEVVIIHVCDEEEKEEIVDCSDASDAAPMEVQNVSAESGEGKVTLFWSPAKDKSEIKNYRVEFGCVPLNSEQTIIFDQSNNVPDNRTQWYVDGLNDDERCSFRVIALDMCEKESSPSPPLSSTTLGAQSHAHSAPNLEPQQELDKSGSYGISIFFALLAGFGMLLIARYRQV
jgi:hypothetical protein